MTLYIGVYYFEKKQEDLMIKKIFLPKVIFHSHSQERERERD